MRESADTPSKIVAKASKENNEDCEAEEEVAHYYFSTILIAIKENDTEDAIETLRNNPLYKPYAGSTLDNFIKGSKPKLEQTTEVKDKLRKLARDSLELKSMD